MTFQVRLYIHHDNDLIQLLLNGVRLGKLFAKALDAHYNKEDVRFELPDGLELKKPGGKVYRIRVNLDDEKQGDLIRWVQAFPDRYKNHCIKNIARSYLGTAAIDALNGMAINGTWTPKRPDARGDSQKIEIHKEPPKKEREETTEEWLDKVSASRTRTAEQAQEIEEEREKIRSLTTEEIFNGEFGGIHEPEHDAKASKPAAERGDGGVRGSGSGKSERNERKHADEDAFGGSAFAGGPVERSNAADETDTGAGDDDELDDFDASLIFESMRNM